MTWQLFFEITSKAFATLEADVVRYSSEIAAQLQQQEHEEQEQPLLAYFISFSESAMLYKLALCFLISINVISFHNIYRYALDILS